MVPRLDPAVFELLKSSVGGALDIGLKAVDRDLENEDRGTGHAKVGGVSEASRRRHHSGFKKYPHGPMAPKLKHRNR